MFEWLIPPALVIGAAFIPKGKINERDVIDKTFHNCRISIQNDNETVYPKLINKPLISELGNYTTYIYNLPFGLKSKKVEDIQEELEEALNKNIDIEYNGSLKIRVFNTKLPRKWNYDNTLVRSGTWEVPIGQNHEGVIYHDFDKYPHFLVGGVTRFGKTVFLKEMIYSLIMNQPNESEFFILDLKGGMEFGHYMGLPQVKAVASDVYEATEVLAYLVDDLKKRQKRFRENGITNIVNSSINKRTFVIVDEGADLSPQIIEGDARRYAKFCQSSLSEIARIGGALGYRLFYCTQYPTREAVPMQVKMNIVARLSFIAAARIASQVILDENGAEELPPIPGRAIYKIEKQRIVQVPYLDDKYMFMQFENAFSE